MNAILDEIRESPDFKSYVEALNQTLRDEEEARQKFRQSLKEDVRAEFINGRVVEHLAAREIHTTTVRRISTLLDTFVNIKGLGAVRSEQALTVFPRNDYAPDICFWSSEKAREFAPDQVLYPIPDFICEVLSPSTDRVDRFVKFRDYQAHGVKEYWLIDPKAEQIEQNVLQGKQFDLIDQFTGGTIRSHSIPGFEMPVRAAFDPADNLATLKRLVAPIQER